MKLSRTSPRLLRLAALALLPLGAFALATATVGEKAQASSHAEAPAIADDPAMDNTDVWAWQDSANTMVIVTAWNGVSYASGGPNYKKWTPKEQGVYEIHIDTNGDGQEDLTYQFQFTNHNLDAASFLRVTSPGTYPRLQGPSDKAQNFYQTYSVSRIAGPRRNPNGVAFLASALPVAPPNTGPQLTWGRLGSTTSPSKDSPATQQTINGGAVSGPTTPSANNDYESKLANLAIQTLSSGEKVFVGPRADAFFVDLGPAFDRLKIRTVGQPIGINGAGTHGAVDVGQYGGGFNTLAGKNVEVIAIQVPLANISGSFPLPIAPNNKFVGVWSSSSRRKIRILPSAGESTNGIFGGSLNGSPAVRQPQEVDAGKLVQVSRLGNPLVNELFIPYDLKDAWNGDEPRYDAAHWSTFLQNPEVAGIINAVYAVVTVPTNPRHDLAFLFAPDTLKVQIDLPNAVNGGNGLKPSDLAFALNSSAPHPVISFSALLGRTPADDVVDIYLKAAAGFLLSDTTLATTLGDTAFPAGGAFPNSALGDGVDFLDSTQANPAPGSGCGIQILNNFPYLGTPYDGQEARDANGNGNDYFKTPRHN